MTYNYDRRQLIALAYIASLAPGIRLMPRYCAEYAGKAAWLAPLAALPVLIIYVWLLSGFLSHRHSGEGLGELILRTNGKIFGGFVLAAASGFLLFCCGFILRSGAERFISTVYPAASPWSFVIVMLLLGAIAALGAKSALVRSAKIFAPVITAVLVLVLAFSLTDAGSASVLPISADDVGGILRAAVPMLEIFAGMLVYASVFENESPKESGRLRAYLRLIIPAGALFAVLCFACVGSYGAAMTARFSHPFFSVIRNVTLFRSIEHIEAVVVALWVLPDFVVFTMMLTAASHMLRLLSGYVPERGGARFFDMKNGRWVIPICAAISLGAVFYFDANPAKLPFFSEAAVPIANMVIVLVLIPICALVCALRDG